jgi:hypothetical protein
MLGHFQSTAGCMVADDSNNSLSRHVMNGSKAVCLSLTTTVKLMTVVAIAALFFRQFLSTMQFFSYFFRYVDQISIVEAVKGDDDKIKLIHIMNAYSVHSKDNATNKTKVLSPFDQWLAIESIQRAKQYAPPELDVEFVCAMFREDRLALPDLPCRTVLLTRSTASEYPFLNTQHKMAKVLPFIQDILDAAIPKQIRDLGDEAKIFVMLTNSDIGVTKHYYQTIWHHLMTREAFSINRLTIPTDWIDETTTTDGDKLLSYIDAILDKGEMHPGYDCFIVRSTVLQRFHLGDMFAGHPPWGTAMHSVLRIMARNYTNIPSNMNGTFHLGNDQSKWLPRVKNKQKVNFADIQNRINIAEECPIQTFGSHPYTLLNTINCGTWFHHDRFHKNHTIPNFVQPGFEDLYLRNYPKILRYEFPNGLGMPSVGTKAKQLKVKA